jgi:hypothetical protein
MRARGVPVGLEGAGTIAEGDGAGTVLGRGGGDCARGGSLADEHAATTNSASETGRTATYLCNHT